MENTINAFCSECGEFAEFIYDEDDWICQNCGGHNTQGDPIDSLPPVDDIILP